MRTLILVLIQVIFLAGVIKADTLHGPAEITDKVYGELVVYGPLDLHYVKSVNLNVYGSLEFDNLVIDKNLKVVGSVKGEDLKSYNLDIIGSVKLTNAVITGKSVIIGQLKAKHSQFADMELTAEKITLENTNTKNLLIKNTGSGEKQTLILKGKNLIKGNIAFESNNGTVIVSKETLISGKVRGGEKISE